MQLSVGNPVRLLAIVGAVAALGAGMFMLKSARGGGGETAQPTLLHTTIGKHALRHRTTPARHQPARHPARPAKSHQPAVAANGLPRVLAVALAKHSVVVVSVVSRGRVDELALREARAAAAAADAGFVKIDALREAEIAPLEAKVDVQGNPALLVMRRPTEVTFQVSGFADRDSIVQAIADARLPR